MRMRHAIAALGLAGVLASPAKGQDSSVTEKHTTPRNPFRYAQIKLDELTKYLKKPDEVPKKTGISCLTTSPKHIVQKCIDELERGKFAIHDGIVFEGFKDSCVEMAIKRDTEPSVALLDITTGDICIKTEKSGNYKIRLDNNGVLTINSNGRTDSWKLDVPTNVGVLTSTFPLPDGSTSPQMAGGIYVYDKTRVLVFELDETCNLMYFEQELK